MNWLAWAIASAFFAGVTAVLAKVGVEKVDPNLATAIRTCVILIISWGIVLATSSIAPISTLTARTWIFLILSGVATGLSWICYFQALKVGQVAQVVAIDKLSIVIAVVLALLFIGERISWRECTGIFLITIGSLFFVWK